MIGVFHDSSGGVIKLPCTLSRLKAKLRVSVLLLVVVLIIDGGGPVVGCCSI